MKNLAHKILFVVFSAFLFISLPLSEASAVAVNGACDAGKTCDSGLVCSNSVCVDGGGACSGINVAGNPACETSFNDTTTSNKLVKVLCNAYGIATGTGGKTLAAFAIISAGIGFFTGKVSWGLLIGIAAGVGAMFGAPSIVAAISGDKVDIHCRDLIR